MNHVIIIGRLGQDPELKHTNSGQAVCTVPVATDESYKDAQGQKVEKTEWHRVQLWRQQAEFAANYLTKGCLVAVEGKIQTRKWQDQQGQDRYTTEIVARKVKSLARPKGAGHAAAPAPDDAAAPPQWDVDDIPF